MPDNKPIPYLRLGVFYCLIPLLLGGIIYVGWRPAPVLLAWVAESLGLTASMDAIRTYLTGMIELPGFVLYTLPDGLWSFAVGAFVALVWCPPGGVYARISLVMGPLLAAGYELAQLVQWVPGTYTVPDLVVSILCAWIAALIICHKCGRKQE